MPALVPRQSGSFGSTLGDGLESGEALVEGFGLADASGSTTAPEPVFASLMMIGSSFCNFANRMLACS